MAGVEYAVADDGTSIAFRVLDADPPTEAPRDVVLIPAGVIPVEIAEDEPGFARLLEGLRGLGRVILFDRRGVGLSDPIVDWQRPVLDQWADDLAAVVRSTGAHEVVVVSTEGYGIGSRFVAAHPEAVGHFVLFGPVTLPDERWDEFRAVRLEQIEGTVRGERDALEFMAPSRQADPTFLEWYHRAGRTGASPATAGRIWASVMDSHAREQRLADVTVPTLVLDRRGNQVTPEGALEHVASLIPHASIVEVDGDDGFAFVGDVDSLVAEISQFVTGARRVPPPQRQLAAVLFSDLVGSTERAAAVGDDRWKSLLNRHDAVVRAAVGQSGGTVIKTTGDGVLALFPSASSALQAARRCRAHVADVDLRIRVGVHVGDIDRRGDDVSGLTVNIAARVMALAPDDGIAVTDTVVATMAGQPATFEPMGRHTLKGVPGTWELYRVTG